MRRRAILGGAGSALLAPSARAQAVWPQRPVNILVGYPAGGANDIVARTVGDKMRASLGQPIIVENRGGAAGTVAAAQAARAAPDGYNLFMCGGAHALAPSLFRSLSYDIASDFRAVSLCGSSAYVLVVHPSVPAQNVAGFIAHLRANPGRLNYASSGVGAPLHLAAVLFQLRTETRMEHVPFQGDADALNSLVAGHVQLGFMSISSSRPLIEAGRLRALAVTDNRRSPALPDVPTMEESGVADYRVSTWWGLLAPRGTPEDIVARLHRAAAEACRHPDVVNRFLALGITAIGNAPDEFQTFIRDEVQRFAALARAAGVQPQ